MTRLTPRKVAELYAGASDRRDALVMAEVVEDAVVEEAAVEEATDVNERRWRGGAGGAML